MASGRPPEQMGLFPDIQRMHWMEERLTTFSRWPDNSPAMSCDMANNGLFYTGRGDTVQCFECGVCMHQWHRRDTPYVRHREASPNCPIANGDQNGTANVPLFVDLHGTSAPNHTRVTTSSSGSGGELESDGAPRNRSESQSKDRVRTSISSLGGKAGVEERATLFAKESGFPEDDIEKAIRMLSVRGLEVHADNLIETLYVIQEEREQAEYENAGLRTTARCISNDADDEYSPSSSQ